MSEGGGMDYRYVDNAVSNANAEMRAEIDSVRRELQIEIQRLEAEMLQVGNMIVDAISRQTAAVVGGVAATTAMIERTKSQIEEDFAKTRSEIELQIESGLQIEIGKKLADAASLKSKVDAFVSDVKTCFDKAITSVAINRELYNVNFKKITDEYQDKLRHIGEHIVRIKLEDISPAIKAAQVPYEEAHCLPIEMDLKRLSVRSENLDETLEILKSSRLDEVVSSLTTLETALDYFALGAATPGENVAVGVEAMLTSSDTHTAIISGMVANNASTDKPINLSITSNDLAVFCSEQARVAGKRNIDSKSFRDLSPAEVISLDKAAKSLLARSLISADALELFQDYLGSGNLKFVES